MHLLGIFSALLKGNKAPVIEEDSSLVSLQSDLAEPPTPVRAPPTKRRKSIRGVAAKEKSVPKKARKVVAKRTTRGLKKSVPVAVATTRPVRIKSEPHWDRRSRRKSRGYKKGSLSESNLQAKAWKGTGTSSDPYILYQY